MDAGPRQRAAEAEIERDVAEWVGPQDVSAYRKAMRETTAYKLAVLSDAMGALIYAHPFTRALVWLRIIPRP